MIYAITAIALLAAPAIGIAVLVYIPVRSLLNFRSAKSGRVYIVFKALASLATWFFASCGWLYMFFAMAYWTGPFVEGEMGEAASLFFLDLLYAAIGGGLALWVRHKSYREPRGYSEKAPPNNGMHPTANQQASH